MTDKICCNICYKQHDPAYPGAASGYGCASFVNDEVLTGNYGSVVADMMAFEIKGISLQDGGPICDTCVTRMIEAGNLVEMKRKISNPPQLPDELKGILSGALREIA